MVGGDKSGARFQVGISMDVAWIDVPESHRVY